MQDNLDNVCITDQNTLNVESTILDKQNELHIVNEDIQCGHIYLHEPSKMLKFFCIFCEKTYDNINLYCDHLSEHVYGAENNVESDAQQTVLIEGATTEPIESNWEKQNSEVIQSEHKIDNLPDEEVKDNEFLYEEVNDLVEEEEEGIAENCQNSSSEEFHGYDEAELDEDEEESRQFLFDQYTVDSDGVEETKLETEIQNEDEETLDDGGKTVTDFENLIENAKILKQQRSKSPEPLEEVIKLDTPEPLVKRLKIITLKNKIDELYSMFKPTDENEEKKDTEEEGNSSEKTVLQQTTQIIGETVITSVPVEVSISKYYGGDEFKCLACEKVFRNQASLATHSRTHYLESKSLIKVAHKCADCNKLFNKLKDLQKHIHEVHYPEGFKCRLCHKTLRSMALLEVHMKKMHVNGRVTCRFCGLPNFKNIQEYEEHMATHGSDDSYNCYICGKQYTQEWNLKNHLKQHALRSPKCCVVCGKITMRLTQHMKIHSPRPARLHQCPICNNIFSFSSALSRHIKVMHKLPRTGRSRIARKDSMKALKRRRRPKIKINENLVLSDTEEAGDQKKVIVEMIENVVNRRSLLDENNTEYMDCTVARYETIAAVNSISSPSQKQ